MSGERIARRSVAFFLIKSSVNFIAVAVLGTVMAVGLLGPELSLWLTAFPAVAAAVALGASVRDRPPWAGSHSRARRRPGCVARQRAVRRALTDGSAEALKILRSGDRRVLAGSFGYWAFDNAVLWATFHAFDLSAAAHRDPDGLSDRPARRSAPDSGWDRWYRRRADRDPHRLRSAGGGHRRGGASRTA